MTIVAPANPKNGRDRGRERESERVREVGGNLPDSCSTDRDGHDSCSTDRDGHEGKTAGNGSRVPTGEEGGKKLGT